MRAYKTVLDVTPDHKIFENICDASLIRDSKDAMSLISGEMSSEFDRKTLLRFFRHRTHHGINFKVYQNNDIHLETVVSLTNVVNILPLKIVIGHTKRALNDLRNITGYLPNGEKVKVPKNNLEPDTFIIVDMSTESEGKVRFNLIKSSNENHLHGVHVWKQNGFHKYEHQQEHVYNYYMPPDKGARKVYRTKIDNLIKKVTLMSFLKDEEAMKTVPKEFTDLYRKHIAHSYKHPEKMHEAVFEYIENNYLGQLALKQIIEHKHWNYHTMGVHAIRNMVKYYTNFRQEVPVDYFTCDVSTLWKNN